MIAEPKNKTEHQFENQTRVDLAAVYRLMAHYGWDDLIFTHASARIPGDEQYFLLAPFGTLFNAVKASDLIKVHVDSSSTADKRVSPAAHTVHSGILKSRPDVTCVIHLHTVHGVAVSAQAKGLLPISQQAGVLGEIGMHGYEGIVIREGEKERLTNDLGQRSAMLLRNHGTLAVGGSVAEAFRNIYALEKACQIQIAALSGSTSLVHIEPAIYARLPQESLFGNEASRKKFWQSILAFAEKLDPSFKD